MIEQEQNALLSMLSQREIDEYVIHMSELNRSQITMYHNVPKHLKNRANNVTWLHRDCTNKSINSLILQLPIHSTLAHASNPYTYI